MNSDTFARPARPTALFFCELASRCGASLVGCDLETGSLACSRASSRDRVGIPLVESTPCPRRTDDNLLEQRELFADRCICGYLSVGSRRHAGQRMRFAPDLLAPWPANAVWEILSKAKGRNPIWSARVDDVNHRNFECDEFRTHFRQ